MNGYDQHPQQRPRRPRQGPPPQGRPRQGPPRGRAPQQRRRPPQQRPRQYPNQQGYYRQPPQGYYQEPPKRKRKWWQIVLIVIAVFFVIGLIGSMMEDKDDNPTPAQQADNAEKNEKKSGKDEKTVYGLDEAADYKGLVITVSDFQTATDLEFSTPDPGKEYVTVFVTIQNNTGEQQSIDPYRFQLQLGTGEIIKYDPFTLIADKKDKLEMLDLADGGTTSGLLLFEIPEGDRDLTLYYYNLFRDKPLLSFKIAD